MVRFGSGFVTCQGATLRFFSSDIFDQIVTNRSVLHFFADEVSRAKTAYKAFVEEALEKDLESPWERVYGGGILGDEDFINEVLANIEEEKLQSEHVANRKALRSSVHLDAILAQVSAHVGMPAEEMLKRGSSVRKMVVYVLKRFSDATNKEISKVLGVGNHSAVAKIYARFVEEVEGNDELRRQLKALEAALSPVKARPHG